MVIAELTDDENLTMAEVIAKINEIIQEVNP